MKWDPFAWSPFYGILTPQPKMCGAATGSSDCSYKHAHQVDRESYPAARDAILRPGPGDDRAVVSYIFCP